MPVDGIWIELNGVGFIDTWPDRDKTPRRHSGEGRNPSPVRSMDDSLRAPLRIFSALRATSGLRGNGDGAKLTS